MQMQPVCRLRLAPACAWPAPPQVQRTRAGMATASRGRAWCVCAAPARLLRARAQCGGGATEPVAAARKDGRVDQAEEAGLAPEELEVLEEAAITGEDEGRRPTDYDRRAHIFEESSRVFRELKKRSDGDSGGNESGSATAAETRACNE